jgi:hypothetical protein
MNSWAKYNKLDRLWHDYGDLHRTISIQIVNTPGSEERKKLEELQTQVHAEMDKTKAARDDELKNKGLNLADRPPGRGGKSKRRQQKGKQKRNTRRRSSARVF